MRNLCWKWNFRANFGVLSLGFDVKTLIPQGLTGRPNYFGLLNKLMTLIICESLREIGEVACVTSAWSSRGQTLKFWSWKSEVGTQKLEAGTQKSAVGSRQSTVGSRKSEVGSRKLEVGSRKSEVGSRGSPSWAFVLQNKLLPTQKLTKNLKKKKRILVPENCAAPPTSNTESVPNQSNQRIV